MRNIPVVTRNLLIINILAFFAYEILGGMGVDLNSLFGLHFFLPGRSGFGSCSLICLCTAGSCTFLMNIIVYALDVRNGYRKYYGGRVSFSSIILFAESEPAFVETGTICVVYG